MRFYNHKTTTRAFFGHSVCKRAFAINHAKTRQRAKYMPVVTLDPADNVLIRRGDEWRVSSRLIANRPAGKRIKPTDHEVFNQIFNARITHQ